MTHLLQSMPVELRRRLVVSTVTRSIGIIVILLTIYFLLPLNRSGASLIVLWSFIGTVVLLATIALQLRAIRASDFPILRAVESVALAVPLLVVIFSSAYVLMSDASPDSFTEPLNHVDALYFTLVSLATIGYGDITPVTETARVVVMVQIVANIAVLGVALKLIVGVARTSARQVSERR